VLISEKITIPICEWHFARSHSPVFTAKFYQRSSCITKIHKLQYSCSGEGSVVIWVISFTFARICF